MTYLVDKGVLVHSSEGGRSTRYTLNLAMSSVLAIPANAKTFNSSSANKPGISNQPLILKNVTMEAIRR